MRLEVVVGYHYWGLATSANRCYGQGVWGDYLRFHPEEKRQTRCGCIR